MQQDDVSLLQEPVLTLQTAGLEGCHIVQWLQKLSVPSMCGKKQNRELKKSRVLRRAGKSWNQGYDVLHYDTSQ